MMRMATTVTQREMNGTGMRSVEPWFVAMAIVRRDVLGMVRQPIRLAAALGTPVLLWLFLASGFSRVVAGGEGEGAIGYPGFVLPGVMTLVAVFSTIFASINLIDERNTGWLRAVLISPSPRWSIAMGKLMGGAVIGWGQAVLLLPAVWVIGPTPPWWGVLVSVAVLFLTCLAVAGLGLNFAWRAESTASFHAVMNLVFLPMWLLSGAIIPFETAAGWFAAVMWINPLTWCTHAIRAPLLGEFPLMAVVGTIAFAGLMVSLVVVQMRRPLPV